MYLAPNGIQSVRWRPADALPNRSAGPQPGHGSSRPPADLFAEHGIDGVSVDAVAAAAGRTSGAVYDHFGSKHGLLLALLDDWSGALVAVMTAQFEISTDMGDRLGAVWDNVCANPSEGVRRLFLLEHELWLRAARDPRLGVRPASSRTRESNERIARGLARWQSEGRLEHGSSPDAGLGACLKAHGASGCTCSCRPIPNRSTAHAAIRRLGSIVGVRSRVDDARGQRHTEQPYR